MKTEAPAFYQSQAFTLWTREEVPSLNKGQQKAMTRIVRYYESSIETNRDQYSLTVNSFRQEWGTVVVSLRIRRLDCHAYSQRALICDDGGHFFIGKKGKLKIGTSYRLETSKQSRERHLRHLAFMMRGSIL